MAAPSDNRRDHRRLARSGSGEPRGADDQQTLRVPGQRETLSDRARREFYGLSVAEAPPETIIFGDVVDESHLHGILRSSGRWICT